MIKQQRIDVTDIKPEEIHPDFLTSVLDVEIKVEDEDSRWVKVLPVKKVTGKSFRLVHDGTKAFIIEGTEENITTTIHAVEEFVTEQEAIDRIAVLGLEYDLPKLEAIEK